jgi:hypothetical protein
MCDLQYVAADQRVQEVGHTSYFLPHGKLCIGGFYSAFKFLYISILFR